MLLKYEIFKIQQLHAYNCFNPCTLYLLFLFEGQIVYAIAVISQKLINIRK